MIRVIFIILLLAPGLVRAQRTTATAQLDSAQIQVGSPVRLTLEVRQRVGEGSLQWAQLPDSFAKLEVLQRGKIDTISGGGNAVYRQEIVLTGFDSVLTAVPPLTFAVKPDLDAPYAVTTERLPLLVSTLPVDTTQPILPIRDIVGTPGGIAISWNLLFVLAGLALLALIVFTVLYWRRRKSAVPRKPAQTALEGLEALRAEGLVERGEAKQHYIRLSDILREELALRYAVSTRERPTGEIIAALRSRNLPAALTDKLETVLGEADAVKFARLTPDAASAAATMDRAKDILTETAKP